MQNPPTALGEKTFLALFSVRGEIPKGTCESLTKQIVAAIGMSPLFDPKVWQYPDEKVGYIYVQPIYESYIAWDVWPKWNGAYLVVCSCKTFDASKVRDVISEAGLKIVEVQRLTAGLRNE